MVAIKTKKDLARKPIVDKLEGTEDYADVGYMEKALNQRKNEMKIPQNDLGLDQANLEKAFDGTLLSFKRSPSGQILEVADLRISPQEEKRILEFAGSVVKGNRNYIIEMADNSYKVYGKEEVTNPKDKLLEFAEYPKKKKFEEV